MTRHIRLDPTAARLDCDAFARLLADYLDDDLRPTLRAAADRHRAECAGCEGLVASLDDLRAEAGRLPAMAPPRDLWAGIERRIGARVVELPVVGPRAGALRADGLGPREVRPSWLRGAWAAAAAALLVAGIGGAGWIASRSARADAPVVASVPVAMPAVSVPTPDAGPSRDGAPAPRIVASAAEPARGPGVAGVTPSTPAAPLSPLDTEIATLHRTLDARRTALDTATVRALETNLAILDGAIRESRAALAEEPASQLLHDMLNDALGSKLELMRTAVILSGDD